MERKPVESSNIVSVGYDANKQVLELEFYSGGVYQYSPITQEGYKEFLNSDSLGSYFFKNIKHNKLIKCKKLD